MASYWHTFCIYKKKQKEKNMDKINLEKKIAKLESINDQLGTEFKQLDKLLRKVGFEDGIQSLKHAANELLDDSLDNEIN